MAGSEVITLQVGHYANFVGAHWWNMQEGSFGRRQPGFEKEINHDRFFHTGCTSKVSMLHVLICLIPSALSYSGTLGPTL